MRGVNSGHINSSQRQISDGAKALRLLRTSRVPPSSRVGDAPQNAEVLLLERIEVILELVVPGVEDEDLETEGRGGDGEVGQRDKAGDPHFVNCRVFIAMSGTPGWASWRDRRSG